MDIVYADGLLIYAPEDRTHVALDMRLERKTNHSGSFEFTLPPEHPLYDSLQKMKTEVEIYRNGERLWSGRIISSKRDIYRNRTFFCEGELGYFNDSSHMPFSFKGTVAQYLYALIEAHNRQVYTDENKLFKMGDVTIFGTVEQTTTEPATVWSLMSKNLIDEFGGFLVIRYEDDGKYLDYLESYGNPCDQRIELGINLLDLEESIDASGIYTVLVPLGKDENGEYIGIEDVNDGLYYIQNLPAVNLYGRIVKTMIFPDLSKPADILAAGQAELEKTLAIATTIKASAVDLNDAGYTTDRFDIGSEVRVLSIPHGLDAAFFCNSITEMIGNPGSAEYILGASLVSLTSQRK